MNLKDVGLSDIVRVRPTKHGNPILVTVVSIEPDKQRVLVIDESQHSYLLTRVDVIEMIYRADKFLNSKE